MEERQEALKQLEEILPELEGQFKDLDIGRIQKIYDYATGKEQVPACYLTLKEVVTANRIHLRTVIEHTDYYANKPKAKELFEKVDEIMAQIQ